MSNRTELVKLKRTLGRINALAPETAALSDAALQAKTGEFRARLQKGETPRALLPEAYAVIREASRRILGMYPYDVQVMGAIALFAGNIAEMKTGEGKTLVASMPLYLSALTGNSTILVTMNNYLAIRDGELFQKLFAFLGMRLAIGVTDNPKEQLTAAKKRNIYAADVVYTTHAALGFDYLMENLAASREEKFLRPFYYCIIDEADAVLLDSATTPLVISGAPKVQSNLYEIADYFVSALEKDVDFEAEDKNVWLTPAGVRKAEQFFYLDHLYDGTHSDVVRHICLALRAHASFTRDKDYIVQDGSISLIDALSGRILANTKLRAGQHQALEAKEHLKITMENRSMATVTYQSLLRMFPHLAGMTGSGIEDAAELESTYGLKVVRIPTRKKIRRVDLPDRYFPNIRAQILAAFQDTVQLHEKGQPTPPGRHRSSKRRDTGALSPSRPPSPAAAPISGSERALQRWAALPSSASAGWIPSAWKSRRGDAPAGRGIPGCPSSTSPWTMTSCSSTGKKRSKPCAGEAQSCTPERSNGRSRRHRHTGRIRAGQPELPPFNTERTSLPSAESSMSQEMPSSGQRNFRKRTSWRFRKRSSTASWILSRICRISPS